MSELFYSTYSSPFEKYTIVWRRNDSNNTIQRIFLSDQKLSSETKMMKFFPKVEKGKSEIIETTSEKIQQFLEGEEKTFDLEIIDFSRCYDIQKKVIVAENKIPRGWVSTYGRIAKQVGLTNGARVVGNALAKNPFPIIIPCHRAIKSDSSLGGYQGGMVMKRALLEMEGIKFQENGKVQTEKRYY